jgi:hypothetical protein
VMGDAGRTEDYRGSRVHTDNARPTGRRPPMTSNDEGRRGPPMQGSQGYHRGTTNPRFGQDSGRDNGGGVSSRICFQFRDTGSCWRGDSCSFEHANPMPTRPRETEGNRSRGQGPAALANGGSDELKHDSSGNPVPPSNQRQNLSNMGPPQARQAPNSAHDMQRQEHFQNILNIEREELIEQPTNAHGGSTDDRRHPGSRGGAPTNEY